ncbi:MAG: preprotein translocase subunit TatA [Firmicutes bacterium]|nr:preprotein translocase subunit TatA [Bacillota bacterium]
MFNLGIGQLSIILVVGLVIFGPGKLPEVGRSLGKSIDEFKRALSSDPAKEKIVNIQEILAAKKVDD